MTTETCTDIVFHLPDEAATAAFGSGLATLLRAGDTVLLEGPIGAGKSHLVRAFVRAKLGRMEDVPSPTFTLVQTYQAADTEIWHADLYRLSHPDEVLELGLEEAFETAICLIEWPDRLGPHMPETALHVRLSSEGDGRSVHLHGGRAGLLDQVARLLA